MRSRRLTLLAALVTSSTAALAVVATSGPSAASLPSAAPVAPVTQTVPAATVAAVATEAASAPVAATAVPADGKARTTAPARPAAVRAVRRVPAPAPVAAPAPVLADETPAQRGARVLASLGYDWQRLGYRVRFLPARDGLLGLTVPSRRLVQVFVKDSDSDLVLAHTIAHELGHVVDAVEGTPARRSAYLRLRGLDPRTSWFGCSGCTDFATPAGDWAEVFAAWLAGPGDFRSELAGAPTEAELAQLAALLAR